MNDDQLLTLFGKTLSDPSFTTTMLFVSEGHCQRIKEDHRGVFKAHSMLPQIPRSLAGIPFKVVLRITWHGAVDGARGHSSRFPLYPIDKACAGNFQFDDD